MTSQRQLEANRANAKRSTGPRTRSGKGRSSMNAVSHGLTAKNIVVSDEDPDEFERLRADLQADFQPSTRLAHEVVEHLAGLLWRQRRVARLEALLVKAYQAEFRAEIEATKEKSNIAKRSTRRPGGASTNPTKIMLAPLVEQFLMEPMAR